MATAKAAAKAAKAKAKSEKAAERKRLAEEKKQKEKAKAAEIKSLRSRAIDVINNNYDVCLPLCPHAAHEQKIETACQAATLEKENKQLEVHREKFRKYRHNRPDDQFTKEYKQLTKTAFSGRCVDLYR